jgi:hypothetical protein
VIAEPTAIVGLRLVNHRAPNRDPIDIPGALTSALGLFALVYGLSNARLHGWGDPVTVVPPIASPVLLDRLRADREPSQVSAAAAAHHLGPRAGQLIHDARGGRRGDFCCLSVPHTALHGSPVILPF